MKRKYLLPLFLLIQLFFLKIIRFFPEAVDHFYSNGIYIFIAQCSRIILGKIPFSVGDCLYAILILLLLRWFWKNKSTLLHQWKNNLVSLLSILSVFYFLFHFMWAFNYYRMPLFEKMKIEREYTQEDLLDFTQKLISKTNSVQLQITKSDSLKVQIPYSQSQIFKINQNGYQNLALEHPFFSYTHLSVKKSLFSVPLTYMGFGGYLNPFTNEAQVNYLGPLYSFPMTTNHEMAHQMGYASESECNFIGFLASVKNKNLYVQYSGYSLALRYCLGNWQQRDEKIFQKLIKTVHPGILKNYQESEDFWQQYDTFIDKGFRVFYDQFLKINQQQDGIDSYSKYVNLLVNYYKGKEFDS